MPTLPVTGGRPDPRNVPKVSQQSDPGLRVPEGAFTSGQTIALQESLPVFDAAQKIALREQGLRNAETDTEIAGQLEAKFNDIEANGVFDEATVQEATKFASETVQAASGGVNNRELDNRLRQRELGFQDRLAQRSVIEQESRRKVAFTGSVRALGKAVQEDPNVVDSGINVDQVFLGHVQSGVDQASFLGLRGAALAGAKSMIEESVAQDMITPLLHDSNFERARELLRSDALATSLEPGTRREMLERVNQFERELRTARNKGANIRASIRAGNPNFTEAQVDAAAAKVQGFGGEIMIAGNKAFTLDIAGNVTNVIELQSAEEIAESARLIKKAELHAKAEFLGPMFAAFGLDNPFGAAEATSAEAQSETAAEEGGVAQPKPVEIPKSLDEPFGAGVPASEDAIRVAKLTAAAQSLFVAGMALGDSKMISAGRGLQASADSISRSSRDIALDTPLTPENAALMGVEIGTTFRDIQGQNVPSLAQQAEDTARGRAKGVQEAKDEVSLGFINEMIEVAEQLRTATQTDPKLLGVLGTVRKAGQTFTQVMGDLGFGLVADRALEFANDVELTDEAAEKIPSFFNDPTLSNMELVTNALGFIMARLSTASGQRIPVDTIVRSINALKLTGLEGSGAAADRLQFVIDFAERRKRTMFRRSPNLAPDTFAEEEAERNRPKADFRIITNEDGTRSLEAQ
jgi:hypothetical protein